MTFAADPNLMPLPAKYSPGSGRLTIDRNFRISLAGYSAPRLVRALARTVDRLTTQTGIQMPGATSGGTAPATLVITCKGASKPVQALGEDESYTLEVDSSQARLC